jgi:hypothetical protein
MPYLQLLQQRLVPDGTDCLLALEKVLPGYQFLCA